MDYKKEMKKMRDHRKKFFPVIERLLALHDNPGEAGFPVEITDLNEMIIALELLDIGYLDPETVIKKSRFNDITNLFYNGKYPLTESGEAFYDERAGGKFRDLARNLFGIKKR
ncbi:MAG: hypothetical protein MUD12_16155 [Spirochaetes bacterium]|nr:hypothetical protein [Spirochaetota bacterium]